jgi:hypothetical protein
MEQLLEARGFEVEVLGGSLRVHTDEMKGDTAAGAVSQVASENGVVLVELRHERTNLEDRYLTMTNGGKIDD